MRDEEASIQKMELTRQGIVGLFVDNDVDPQEALSLLSGLLVQIYSDMVENNSRENFTTVMTQCYDAFTLIEAESEGSIH